MSRGILTLVWLVAAIMETIMVVHEAMLPGPVTGKFVFYLLVTLFCVVMFARSLEKWLDEK